MTDDIPSPASCGGCGNPLPEEQGEPAGRAPCPVCGAMVRIFSERIELKSVVYLRYMATAKSGERTTGGRRKYESTSGDSLTRTTGRWVSLERRFDRTDPDPANWRYRERIVDQETGEVLRDVDEPLSEHRGRGSAKGRP